MHRTPPGLAAPRARPALLHTSNIAIMASFSNSAFDRVSHFSTAGRCQSPKP